VGLEAAKAGFQLLVLAAAGAGVTGVLEWSNRRQDERRHVNDAAVELLRDLIDGYNNLKGTRRALRNLGFGEPAGRVITRRQHEGFEREMRVLLEVQLTLERIGREIGIRLGEDEDEDEDDTHAQTRPQQLLAGMESCVKAIVDEWEKDGARVLVGGETLAASMAALPKLRAFAGHGSADPKDEFRT
jgi:hypothetical protein